MSQERLNSPLTLHIHKENTLILNLADIGNDFVSAKENRMTRLVVNFRSVNIVMQFLLFMISVVLMYLYSYLTSYVMKHLANGLCES